MGKKAAHQGTLSAELKSCHGVLPHIGHSQIMHVPGLVSSAPLRVCPFIFVHEYLVFQEKVVSGSLLYSAFLWHFFLKGWPFSN